MAGKEIAVKKYVVRLDAEERDRLNELICKGKRSAQLTKAHPAEGDRFDAGWLERQPDCCGAGHQRRHCRADPGASWSIAVPRRCWPANTTRTPPGGGFSTAQGKQTDRADPLRPRKQFARWSLRLLEEKVVELHIVERASDNTIGRGR